MALSRTQPASPAPYSRIPYAPRPAVRRTSKRAGLGDEVQHCGRTGYVDDIDANPYGDGLAAYVVYRAGGADWIALARLHVIRSAAVLH